MFEAITGFAVLLFLMIFLRTPIPFAMALVGVAGLAMMELDDTATILDMRWNPYLNLAARRIVTTAQSYELSVIPLFILMGNFVTHSGLSHDLYNSSYRFIGHRKGGLAMATIVSCGFFSAICGSSLATAATMAKVSLPAMRKFKYDDKLATACIAAGGTLGILIPPSVLLILYGLLTETSIRELFAAGFIPGIIGVCFYLIAVQYVIFRNPNAGPPGEIFSFKQKMHSLSKVWGILVLFIVVLGGIYAGVFTPTEAAGIGAGGAFIIALLKKTLNRKILWRILSETAQTSAVLFSILIGSLIFSNFISRTTLPDDLTVIISAANIAPWVVIAIILMIYVMLGMVFESISMIMLTVPIFFPVIQSLGYDPVWFGILVVVVTEISLISPPVGLNVFVLSSVIPDIKTGTIFRGIIPFFMVDVLRLLLLALIPAISLLLPNLLYH